MLHGIVLTIGVELCLLITYLFVRARKENKEEEQRIYMMDEDLYI